jgi:hypothetical protein
MSRLITIVSSARMNDVLSVDQNWASWNTNPHAARLQHFPVWFESRLKSSVAISGIRKYAAASSRTTIAR